MNRATVVAAVGICALLAGCATLVNPGKTYSAPQPGGSRVRMARLRLKNTGPVLAVYDGETQLDIQDAADHDLHVSMCRTYRENPLETPGLVTVSTDCMSRILFPYIDLPKSGRHTLRLVANGQEATVTVKAGMHIQWFWLNGVCLAVVPACWAVDLANGSWSYYGSLDVGQALRSARTRSAAASHD